MAAKGGYLPGDKRYDVCDAPDMTQALGAPEPAVLRRLRQAVRASGLNVDLGATEPGEQALVVSNRLAQTTVRYLCRLEPATGQRLSEELRGFAGPAEYDLLMEDRGFTFIHVVQFLYEWAKHHLQRADREYFCYGMGHGGGGVEVRPDTEVASLLELLLTSMPADRDADNLGELVTRMFPLLLGTVFSAELFRFEVHGAGDNRLRLSLGFVDDEALTAALARHGLQDDVGLFFLNSALHIQGSARLGLDTFARDASRAVRLGPAIQELSAEARARLTTTRSIDWDVEWSPEVQVRRRRDAADLIGRAETIFAALQRRDVEYYLQRIQSLEVRVQSFEEGDHFHELVGRSARMHQLYQLIEQVAGSDLTVLIRGESGTGKELVARATHHSSPRAERPFVPVNCAAFTESLLESELFGHEKGAFTGADHTKLGRFELADGGTLFLDEVGDIPLTTQVKILRALEARSFERVGGTESIEVDLRIVAATNRDLEELIADGQFREDLYFRLNVVPVRLPSLREHAEDIPQLAHSFLQQLAKRAGGEPKGLARGAIDRLLGYSWPGNIRELRNVIERAAVVYSSDAVLREGDIVRALGVHDVPAAGADLNVRQARVLECLGGAEATTIDDLLTAVATGDSGGTSRRTLQNDLRRLTDLGYTRWQKQGAVRRYELTPEGRARQAE